MREITELIVAGGTALPLGRMWDHDTRHLIAQLCEETIAAASQGGLDQSAAVVETILGLYAHAFYVGRDHALAGLHLPATSRRGLAGISTENLNTVIIPDDLSSL